MATEAPKLSLNMEDAAFWCVWTKKGRNPRFIHSSRASAEAEAIRLAMLFPGRKFIVLEAKTKFRCDPVAQVPAETEQVAA